MNGADAEPGYRRDEEGIFVPQRDVRHRGDCYDEAYFEGLAGMQDRHFWYRGRHRFLLSAFDRHGPSGHPPGKKLSAVDIGCGCGAWVRCLACHAGPAFKELALADSSRVALKVAARENDGRSRYQVDLLDLQWRDRWDMAFMLDVLEHV